jgi:chromosome segregation ATPase
MKRFISKVQNLSQKAAEIKAAMQQVPPKVAEIREAVAATTGQLQQLKSEIHYSVADLKADNEDRLSEAMQEINASAAVFVQAGFILSGVDLEISPVQRMLVHLTKAEDVHASMLRSLVSANQHRRTTHAILSSLLQANQMADTVELGDLVYDEVIVGVGPIPSVRLRWPSV